MKNVSRNKFLLCFRPVVDMDVDLLLESEAVVIDRSQNRALTAYVDVKNKEDMKMKPSWTKSCVSDAAENSVAVHRPGRKTFSQVIKAVVFEIVLAKRVRERKGIDQRSISPKQNLELSSRECNKFSDTSCGKSVNKALAGKEMQDTLSKSDSVSSLSSCSSSTSSSSPNLTQKPESQKLQNNDGTCRNHQGHEIKTKQGRIDSGSSRNSAIFLLVVSLALTIFWGKICAILFTSTWLYFPPQRQHSGVIGNLENLRRNPEKKSRDHNKKVIMEGLLDRNYIRGT